MKYSLAFENKNSRRKKVVEGYVYEHKWTQKKYLAFDKEILAL